jgi:hypothetical protein
VLTVEPLTHLIALAGEGQGSTETNTFAVHVLIKRLSVPSLLQPYVQSMVRPKPGASKSGALLLDGVGGLRFGAPSTVPAPPTPDQAPAQRGGSEPVEVEQPKDDEDDDDDDEDSADDEEEESDVGEVGTLPLKCDAV